MSYRLDEYPQALRWLLFACWFGFPLAVLLAGLGARSADIMEWRYLTAVQFTEEQQRSNRVWCDDSQCWGEVGGFRDGESCTLALLAQQAETTRRGGKVLRIEGGNKCFEAPKRGIKLKA